MGIDKCLWDVHAECRHPEWFKVAQDYIDAVGLHMIDAIEAVEHQHNKLKEGCKICVIAECARQLRLLAVRTS